MISNESIRERVLFKRCCELDAEVKKLKKQLNWIKRTRSISFEQNLYQNGKKHRCGIKLDGGEVYGVGNNWDEALADAMKNHPI